MKKTIRSDNPIKKNVTDALKKKSGSTKITNVKDNGDGTFSGDCLKSAGRRFIKLGTFTVEASEAGLTLLGQDRDPLVHPSVILEIEAMRFWRDAYSVVYPDSVFQEFMAVMDDDRKKVCETLRSHPANDWGLGIGAS